MPLRLKIELILGIIFFLIVIYNTIKNKKINIKYSIIWIISAVIMMTAVLIPDFLQNIANLIGIKTVSNMVFLCTITILLLISFSLTAIVSTQKRKITLLVQELGLLQNRIYENEKEL